jgi:hypothetical protein
MIIYLSDIPEGGETVFPASYTKPVIPHMAPQNILANLLSHSLNLSVLIEAALYHSDHQVPQARNSGLDISRVPLSAHVLACW